MLSLSSNRRVLELKGGFRYAARQIYCGQPNAARGIEGPDAPVCIWEYGNEA